MIHLPDLDIQLATGNERAAQQYHGYRKYKCNAGRYYRWKYQPVDKCEITKGQDRTADQDDHCDLFEVFLTALGDGKSTENQQGDQRRTICREPVRCFRIPSSAQDRVKRICEDLDPGHEFSMLLPVRAFAMDKWRCESISQSGRRCAYDDVFSAKRGCRHLTIQDI